MSKFEIVKSMNTIVESLNNESAYYGSWIYIVPDQASDDDLRYIAEDKELFADTINCFKEIINKYLKDGIYVGGKLY